MILILLCVSCSNRVKLDKPINLGYSDEHVVVDIIITHRSKNKFISGPESWYSFYGVMDSHLLILENKPEKLVLLYNGKKSEIYLDTMVSIADFWDRSWWDEKGFRKNKVYIPFSDKEVEWGNIKFIEIERGKEFMYRY